MDSRDAIKGNNVTLSIGPVYLNIVPGTNWGVPTESSAVIVLDPQVNVGPVGVKKGAESSLELLNRKERRSLMMELADEFSLLHADLLRELAR